MVFCSILSLLPALSPVAAPDPFVFGAFSTGEVAGVDLAGEGVVLLDQQAGALASARLPHDRAHRFEDQDVVNEIAAKVGGRHGLGRHGGKHGEDGDGEEHVAARDDLHGGGRARFATVSQPASRKHTARRVMRCGAVGVEEQLTEGPEEQEWAWCGLSAERHRAVRVEQVGGGCGDCGHCGDCVLSAEWRRRREGAAGLSWVSVPKALRSEFRDSLPITKAVFAWVIGNRATCSPRAVAQASLFPISLPLLAAKCVFSGGVV